MINEQGHCRDILFDYTVRGKCFQFQCFQWIMKWDNLINLVTLYKSSIEHYIELLDILFYPKFTFLLLNATANDMAAKTEKSKVPDARVRNIISKGPKYRFPSNIDFSKCRREIAASLNDFSNRWCKRENVEPDALKEWKINIFKIIDTRISFYSRNTHLLPPKPKSSFRHLKRGIQDFHMNYVLVPADEAANNVVVV